MGSDPSPPHLENTQIFFLMNHSLRKILITFELLDGF